MKHKILQKANLRKGPLARSFRRCIPNLRRMVDVMVLANLIASKSRKGIKSYLKSLPIEGCMQPLAEETKNVFLSGRKLAKNERAT